MKSIVILASGSGSNAENIIDYFDADKEVTIKAVFTNNTEAGVLERCKRLNVAAMVFNRVAFYGTSLVVDSLKAQNPDLIVLAGFLWKIPENLITIFPKRIINIHPALLPKYGGKGMYGSHVHEAVKANGESETGITIHYVNENYDEGAIIHQERTSVSASDSIDDIAEKVHRLEYEHLPKVIENILKGNG